MIFAYFERDDMVFGQYQRPWAERNRAHRVEDHALYFRMHHDPISQTNIIGSRACAGWDQHSIAVKCSSESVVYVYIYFYYVRGSSLDDDFIQGEVDIFLLTIFPFELLES